MTCINENTPINSEPRLPAALPEEALLSLLPLLSSGSDSRFRDALQLLLNASMLLERQQHLRAEGSVK